MPRGYRCIVLAAFGWLILTGANHADPKAEAKQAQARQAISGHLGNLSSAYEAERAEKAQSPEEASPCGERQYGGNADLCAQWKAADAAVDSAWWAWASGVLSLISVIGIIFALFLTVDSNRIARDSARRQLRPYFTVEHIGFFGMAPRNKKANFSIHLINSGQTPAYDVKASANCYIASTGHVPKLCRDAALSVQPSYIIGPSQDHVIQRRDFKVTPRQRQRFKAKRARVFLVYAIEYSDGFGSRYRMDLIHRSFPGGGAAMEAVISSEKVMKDRHWFDGLIDRLKRRKN